LAGIHVSNHGSSVEQDQDEIQTKTQSAFEKEAWEEEMSSPYGDMFDGLSELFKLMVAILIVAVPLGLWKLIEIIAWCLRHVEIAK